MTDTRGLTVSRESLRLPAGLLVVGVATVVYGLAADPARTWPNLLVGSFYVLSLAVSAIFFFATQRLTSARWSVALRRVPEAYMALMPVAALLMVLLSFGFESLYPWADPAGLPHHASTGGKPTYLAPGFVLARMGVILVVWIAFALRVRSVSLAQDTSARAAGVYHQRLNRLAGVFAPVFAFTFTAASYDWIISLEPEWFSTMFAVYVFAGTFVQGIAAVTLTTVVLMRRGLLGNEVGEKQLHDLGKMLFAFSTFWAYIWVCQYLLIWYGNIPEEATYYLRRTNGPWLPVFLINLFINWILPFCALLAVRAKKNQRLLAAVSALFLVGHWLDLTVMVIPSKWGAPQLGFIELGTAVGCAGLIYLVVVRALSRAPLVPVNDLVLAAERAPGGGES
jgi:hypothetical protein